MNFFNKLFGEVKYYIYLCKIITCMTHRKGISRGSYLDQANCYKTVANQAKLDIGG